MGKSLKRFTEPLALEREELRKSRRVVPRSTLYRNLPKLEGKGYIRKDQDGKYLITEKGIEFHRELLSDVLEGEIHLAT